MTDAKDIPQQTDAELVQIVAQGGYAAMTELVHRYEVPLRRYVVRICTPCAPYREDLLQESFLKMFRNIHDFDSSLKFSTWIYRITHNVVIDHVRKRANGPSQSVEFVEGGEGEEWFAGARFRTDEPMERRELQARIKKILTKIPTDQRAAFVLRFWEEKEYEEIGDILKQNLNTVATWIRRAREIFKKEAFAQGLHWNGEEDHGSRN